MLSESRNFMGLGTCHLTAMFKHTRCGVGGYRLRIIIELYSFIRKISFQSYVLTIELTNKYVLGGSSGIGRGAVLLLSINLVAVLLLEGETKLNLIMWQLNAKRPEAMLR